MEIAGYIYCADIYCPACIVEEMIRRREASPGARDMDVEEVLDQIASANAIDRYDESSYDSGEFPKVVFALECEKTWCGRCGCNIPSEEVQS